MIHLSDEVERAFRVWLAQKGGKRGDISKEMERLLRRELKMKQQTKSIQHLKGGDSKK